MNIPDKSGILSTNGANLVIWKSGEIVKPEGYLFDVSIPDVLIIQRKDSKGWCLPGGKTELDLEQEEPFLTTALRETEEEIGYRVDVNSTKPTLFLVAQQRVLIPCSIGGFSWKITATGTVLVFAHESPDLQLEDLNLQGDEVLEAKWIPLRTALFDANISLGYRRMLAHFGNMCIKTLDRAPVEGQGPVNANLGTAVKLRPIIVTNPDQFVV